MYWSTWPWNNGSRCCHVKGFWCCQESSSNRSPCIACRWRRISRVSFLTILCQSLICIIIINSDLVAGINWVGQNHKKKKSVAKWGHTCACMISSWNEFCSASVGLKRTFSVDQAVTALVNMVRNHDVQKNKRSHIVFHIGSAFCYICRKWQCW